MTNREKAMEIVNNQWQWLADFIEKNNLSKEDGKQIRFKMYIACLDMADFKKQEIIDKALKWINDNMCYYDENGFDYSGSGILKDFKKAMEK